MWEGHLRGGAGLRCARINVQEARVRVLAREQLDAVGCVAVLELLLVDQLQRPARRPKNLSADVR